VVTDQTVQNGVVQIRVIEGGLEAIEVEGTQALRKNYVKSRLQLADQTPLSRDRLEDQLRLLKADPLFTNVEASLKPGKELGKSILVVRVTEAPVFSGFAGVDNYSPPSVGSVRLGGGVSYRNVTGLGDEFSAAYYRTTRDGANIYDLSYRLPLNPMNGTLQLRYAPNDNRIIDSTFASLNIRGQSELMDISFRQPLKRTPREEFALSLGLAVQNGQTFLFNNTPTPFGIGPDASGKSRTRVLKFGQDYLKRDPKGAWALRSQFNLGLDVFDATTNPEPIPDGRFFSWLGQVQRVQRLSNDQLLIVQADVQLSPDSLLPSQQYVIGGGQSVRGFRQNARSGDNGVRFSVENRIALQRDANGTPTFQVAPFADLGTVWNQSGNPNTLPNQKFLAGAGLGVLWQPHPRINVRLDYAIPLVKLSDKGKDVQDDGFYFSVNYQF
jgi:hemolysin activation/secretion protein